MLSVSCHFSFRFSAKFGPCTIVDLNGTLAVDKMFTFTLEYTVKRPKFGNGPLVRHPLFEVLKNHSSAGTEVSNLVQRGERL
jgi:hypothetical protein